MLELQLILNNREIIVENLRESKLKIYYYTFFSNFF